MSKHLSRIVIVLLSLALIGSLLMLKHQQTVTQRRDEMLELQSSFYFMRDIYLKEQDETERSGYRQILLQMHGLHSYEDESCQLLYELVHRVSNLPSDSVCLNSLSQQLDGLRVIWDMRSDAYDSALLIDAEAIQALIDELDKLS